MPVIEERRSSVLKADLSDNISHAGLEVARQEFVQGHPCASAVSYPNQVVGGNDARFGGQLAERETRIVLLVSAGKTKGEAKIDRQLQGDVEELRP